MRQSLLTAGWLFSLISAGYAQQPDSLTYSQASDTGRLAPRRSFRPEALAFTTLQPALSQTAGVQVTPYSGAPGAGMAVRIRGAASLAGNPQPLYVVDGIPALAGPAGRPSGFNTVGFYAAAPTDPNPLLALPPEDIASVTVLKGAFETARYGAQGQNGVIEITTRRGSFGQRPQVHYSSAGGVQQARARYGLLTAREYAQVANEAAAYQGARPEYTPAQVAAAGAGTDWQDELLRVAAVHEHHLSVAGGSASSRGYLGADYLSQHGIIENSGLRRYGFVANLEQRVGARLRVQAGAQLSQTSLRRQGPTLVLNTLTANPLLAARDAQGQLIETRNIFDNPLRQALQNYEAPRQRRLLGRLGLIYEPLAGLRLLLDAGLERAHLDVAGYRSALGPNFPGGRELERTDTFDKLTLHPALRFERTLAGRHQLTASLEGWRQDYRTSYEFTERTGSILSSSGSGRTDLGLLSYQAQAGYAYAGRYELQGSLRRDASSALAVDTRWLYLPAAQLTWHAAQEAFMRNHAAISRLDLWAGWGQTSNSGNLFDESFSTFRLFNGEERYVFQTEHTTQHEAGLRLGLVPHQLTLGLSAYARRTEVQQLGLFGQQSPLSSEIRNRGLELTLAGAWAAGPLGGTTTLAASHNQNKVRVPGSLTYVGQWQRATDGQPLSQFYGLRYQGVDPATGRPRYEDLNGDGAINFLDQQPLGSGLPRQLLSLTQELTYRRLTLLAQVEALLGYQALNTSLFFLDAAEGYGNNSDRVRERWQPSRRDTDVPAAGARTEVQSSYTLQSGNHARLQSLTLSYQAWQKAARTVSVWVGGQNLLVLTAYRGFDPNVSSSGADHKAAGVDAGAYPVPRTISVGVRATL